MKTSQHLQMVKVSQCYFSPTNPRGTVAVNSELKELIASVKEKGVLVPVLAREIEDGYEVIAGARRLRAAIVAELIEIPAHIVEMNDVEVREAQIVENLQRADIHPLEEGEAYRQLIEAGDGYDVEAVGKKVGKSVTYVRDRLVLTNLIKAGKKAFRDGLITAGHAALVARLDEVIQKEALIEWLHIEDDSQWREVPTTAELRNLIQAQTLHESMKLPPWTNDEEMKATLGGCEECRGKGGDLFGKKSADACTNPKCYAERMAAFIAIKLNENPTLVHLSGGYSNGEDGVIGSGSYREINGKKNHCDHEEKGIIVVGDGMGHVKTICRAPECDKHWPTQKPGGHYKPTKEEIEARRKQRQSDLRKREKDIVDMTDAVEKLSWPLSETHLDVILGLAIRSAGHDIQQGIVKRRVLELITTKDNHRKYEDTIKKVTANMTSKEKTGLLFELLVPAYSVNYGNEHRTGALKKV